MGDSQRSPWFVPLLVALIGALGVVAANVLPGMIESDPGVPAAPSTSAASTVPDIAGEYYMDSSPRVISIQAEGNRSFNVSEPGGPWPFTGLVTWDGAKFVGPASFDSGDEMTVTLQPIGKGQLAAKFEIVSVQGDSRTDRHTLKPVNQN